MDEVIERVGGITGVSRSGSGMIFLCGEVIDKNEGSSNRDLKA